MDYDEMYNKNVNMNYFFTNYPGSKLMVGKINLANAIARLSKKEYYTLVTYKEGESLPEQYVPYDGLSSEDGTLFATINPNVRVGYIVVKSGIQMISRLPDTEYGGPRYLLGPGPEEVNLYDLIQEQYDETIKKDSEIKM